jgi:predicted esterase
MLHSNVLIQGHHNLVMDPPVIEPGSPVILTLHGLGTNGEDLAPLFVKNFDLPGLPLCFARRAPAFARLSTDLAYAWYDFQTYNRNEYHSKPRLSF